MEFKGYIYLDINHPIVAWETYRGALISADQAESDEFKYPSIILAGIIYHNDNTRFANELLFEHIRSIYFPKKISRLRGLYLFQDLDSSQKAIDWGDHFKFENLVEVGVYSSDEPTKVDANWITFAKRDDNNLITEDYIDNIIKYWSGEPYNDDPCWEYLVNGKATVWGTSVRKKAYETIRKTMRESLGMLELSRLALILGSDLGHITPWLQRISNDEFNLTFIMNFVDAKNDLFLEKLSNYKGPRNYKDLNPEKDLISPDLRSFFCTFKLSKINLYGYSNMKIHTMG